MEPVTAACTQWRDALALDALGALEPAERAGLAAHLDGCAACREVAAELRETAAALAFADLSDVGPTADVPPALTERVLGSLHAEAVAARRRRRVRVGALVGAAMAVAASLVVFLALPAPSHEGGARTEVLATTGAPSAHGATASAVLTGRAWGTAIAFTEQGLPPGVIYEVSMRTATGAWWTTGSVRPVSGRAVVAQMACYVPMREVTGIRVTDTAGTALLETVAAPGTSW
jgi:hypothetical protein